MTVVPENSPPRDRNTALDPFRVGPYVFKHAETDSELMQIHRLNHRTFVKEIPQHADTGTEYLVDKFHDKNTYFVATIKDRLVGMISVHDHPPFSIADRLSDPRILDHLGDKLIETRLLAIEPKERNKLVFAGLVWTIYEYAKSNGYTHLLISGVKQRQSMYERLGFRALGPAVVSGEASFVPLALDLCALRPEIKRDVRRWRARMGLGAATSSEGGKTAGDRRIPAAVSLLPGPVQVDETVRKAFVEPVESHRSRQFVERFEKVRDKLRNLTSARDVALFCGSGTVANDAVAAALATRRTGGQGIILVNGEFGERLVDHAHRAGLRFKIVRFPWGQPWNLDEILTAADSISELDWVWGVHLESSTGLLNEPSGLIHEMKRRGVKPCLDCISSLGAVPFDLRDVYLASGASGKALGSYAGIASVFVSRHAMSDLESKLVPAYLDIPAALATRGPRFTFPSSLLGSLDQALAFYASARAREGRYRYYAELGEFIRGELRRVGLQPLAADRYSAPVITTFEVPVPSSGLLDRCESWGFELSGRSSYLQSRNWLQIATMGQITRGDCAPLFERLEEYLSRL